MCFSYSRDAQATTACVHSGYSTFYIMRYYTWLLVWLLSGHGLLAQDFDIYPRMKDDNVKMPQLHEQMTLNEYQILSRDIRMMDMGYSFFVPGYVHFKAKETATGYGVLSARMLGVAGFGLNAWRVKDRFTSIHKFSDLYSNAWVDGMIFFTSASLLMGSYLFDWIHGKARLEQKQEMIRYRYGLKLQLEAPDHAALMPAPGLAPASAASGYMPGISLTVTF